MESTDSSGGPPSQPNLPPGFRFHPTDEELVVHYLKRKAASVPLPVSIIADIDLYKFDPWELPAKASFGEQEWYFFSPRDRKYPNGARPNRAATSGYWKATGTDKPVIASSSSSGGNQKVGVKKALVFYSGKPPKGVKSDWIMHEYRLADNKPSHRCDFVNKKNSLRLDDWVLCRIYKKNNSSARLHTDKDLMMIDDDLFRQISPSISGFHHNNFSKLNFFPARFSSGYGVFSDNNDPAAIYDGGGTNYSGMNLASSSASTAEQLMMANLKRDIPAPYWPVGGDQEDQNSSEKKFNGGGGGGDGGGGGGGECSNITSSMASPLGGILGEGLMRTTTYQSSGLNWYT